MPDDKENTIKKTEEKPNNLGELVKTGGPGRPVGSKNKLPAELRTQIQAVFDNLGGVEGMTEWASRSDNTRTAFYKILASTLPRQVAVSARLERDHGLNKLSDDELMDIIEGAKRCNAEGRRD
jgi:hypothetical protein